MQYENCFQKNRNKNNPSKFHRQLWIKRNKWYKIESSLSHQFNTNIPQNSVDSMVKEDSFINSNEYEYSYDNSFIGMDELKMRKQID